MQTNRDRETRTLEEKIAQVRAKFRSGEMQFIQAPMIECDVCEDKGKVYIDVPVGHPDFGRGVACPNPNCRVGNERKQRIADAVARRAIIPEEYKKLKLGDFLTLPEHYQKGKWAGYGAAVMFCNRQPFTMREAYTAAGYPELGDPGYKHAWVVLTGSYGMGKTGLAAGVANWCADNRVAVMFVRVGSLLQAIRDSYDANADVKTGEILNSAQTVSVLIADEWKGGPQSDHSMDKMEEIIRYRYNHKLPTFFTTNLTVDEFKESWGMRTGSVVAEAHWIEMWGANLRSEAPKAVRSEV